LWQRQRKNSAFEPKVEGFLGAGKTFNCENPRIPILSFLTAKTTMCTLKTPVFGDLIEDPYSKLQGMFCLTAVLRSDPQSAPQSVVFGSNQ